MPILVKHGLTGIIMRIGSRRRGIKVNTFITIIGQTISIASTQATYSDHTSQYKPTVTADSLPQSIQVYRISSIVLQLALVGIHFHIELFGSEHESHVERQRHSVTAKQRIHVPPIRMPVICRISGETDKPLAVYPLYLFMKGSSVRTSNVTSSLESSGCAGTVIRRPFSATNVRSELTTGKGNDASING